MKVLDFLKSYSLKVFRFRTTIIALICTLSVAEMTLAQNSTEFLDKEFYLVDSITGDMLSEHDKHLLDSILPIYHKERENTIQASTILYLTENLRQTSIVEKYNNYALDIFNITGSMDDKNIQMISIKRTYVGQLRVRANIEYEKGLYDKSKQTSLDGLKVSRQIKDTILISGTLVDVANQYLMLGEHEKALIQYKRALELNDLVEDKEGRSGIYVWMGYVYNNQGNVEKALEYYNKALKIDEDLENKPDICNRLSLIGGVYNSQGDTVNAMKNFKRSLSVAKEVEAKRLIADNLGSIAQIHEFNKKYNKSLAMYKESLDLYKKIENHRSITSTFSSIGNIYFKQNKLDSALYYHEKALAKAREGQAIGDLPGILVDYAKVLNEIGRTSKAHQLVKEAYQLASELGYPSSIASSSKLLSETSQKKGDYKTALAMYKLSIQMRDSIQNEDNKKATYKQQMKYEYDKKEEQLKLEEEQRQLVANQEKRVRETVIAGITGVLALSVLFLIYLFNRFRVIQKQKMVIEEQSVNLQTTYEELNQLNQFKEGMTSMIVHDLKNPLNAMLGYAEEVQSVNLKNRIRNTSKMMLNYVLNMLDVQKFESSTVPLELKEQPFSGLLNEVIEQINFLADEKGIQLKNIIKRNYIVNIDAELMSRVLVNLMTNAIKYSPLKSTITLDAHANRNKLLEVTIKDEGQGIPKEMLTKVFDKFIQVEAKKSGKIKSTGLGLTFCKIVTEGHGGEIWVESEEGNGSVFHFTIPLISDAGELLGEIIKENSLDVLTVKEIKFLASIKSALRKYDIMDTVDIMELLDKTRTSKSQAINTWANKVENACLNMDDEDFNALIQ